MRLVGNVIWFLFGGFVGWCSWMLAGILWCISIVGIPIGLQCFKFATLSLWPFGKDLVLSHSTGAFLLNIIWLLVSGIPLAIGHFISGLLLLVTIVGIPFAKQSFKLAKLALMPFGARVIKIS